MAVAIFLHGPNREGFSVNQRIFLVTSVHFFFSQDIVGVAEVGFTFSNENSAGITFHRGGAFRAMGDQIMIGNGVGYLFQKGHGVVEIIIKQQFPNDAVRRHPRPSAARSPLSIYCHNTESPALFIPI